MPDRTTTVLDILDDALDDLPRYFAISQPENGWLPMDPGASPRMKCCVYVDDVREMLRRKLNGPADTSPSTAKAER